MNRACPPFLACAAEPQCQALVWCLETNPFYDRLQACSAPYDAGYEAFVAAARALRTNCATACAEGNEWYCVGNVVPPASAAQDTVLHLELTDLISGGAVADASVVVCSTNEPSCSTRLDSTISGTDGGATVTVPQPVLGPGATGYLSLGGAGLFPELFFWGFPMSEPSVGLTAATLMPEEASQLAASVGVPVDKSRGMVAAIVSDCWTQFSPGVELSITPKDPDTQVFYLLGGTGSTGATGVGLVVNVPVGPITVTATPNALGRSSSIVTGFVRAGTLTALGMPPNQ